jgi:hypothetical protein
MGRWSRWNFLELCHDFELGMVFEKDGIGV